MVAWNAVRLLAVSEGRQSRSQQAWRGARRGFVMGLITGGVVAVVTVIACSGDVGCFGYESVGTLFIPAGLVVIGTAAGAGIGAAFPGERWRAVIPPRRE